MLVLLDCPPEIGLARAAKAGAFDRIEEEKLAFHERVRAGYHAHVHEYPTHHIIDAAQRTEDVARDIARALSL